MADYWKSQPRKFCEFCKCWITDNKPSVEFHERGKRHKENVQKKIDELRKRSGEKAKEQEEINAGLAHIEKAALEALKRDIAQDPGLAAQYGVKIKTAGPQTREECEKENKKSTPANKPPTVKEWFEAKSPEGYSYYWNINTNESVWEPPAEYVSLAEQDGDKVEEEGCEEKAQESLEDRDHEYEEQQKPPPKKILRVDPVGARGAAYGAWTTIREELLPEQEEPEPEPEQPDSPAPKVLPALVDIPLPEDIPLPGEIPLPAAAPPKATMQPLKVPLPASTEEPPQEKESSVQLEVSVKKDRFKEKTVASLGFSAGGSVGFKKRKVASSARNSRQRDADD